MNPMSTRYSLKQRIKDNANNLKFNTSKRPPPVTFDQAFKMDILLLPLLIFLCLVSSSPVPQASNKSFACSQIQSWLTPNTNCQLNFSAPAQLAWDCLQSIPLNATGADQLAQSLKPYIQFQSTLSWLKNPPTEYADKLFGSVDLIGGLDQIVEKIKGEKYSGEYNVRPSKASKVPMPFMLIITVRI
jgi:hypothetical protein